KSIRSVHGILHPIMPPSCMDILSLFLRSSGRLARRPFVIAALSLYAAGVMSQLLLSSAVMTRLGLWAFALVQAFLIWSWYAVHAKRLRDAAAGVGTAAGVAAVCLLADVLFLLVLAMFGFAVHATDSGSPADAVGFFAALYIFGVLFGVISQGG